MSIMETEQGAVWKDGTSEKRLGKRTLRSPLDLICGWHVVFALGFSTVSGPQSPVHKHLSIPAQLPMCQRWSMRRHGEEKVGTWLEVALDRMLRSWWVGVIVFIWAGVGWRGGGVVVDGARPAAFPRPIAPEHDPCQLCWLLLDCNTQDKWVEHTHTHTHISLIQITTKYSGRIYWSTREKAV